jgi:hypothetical protein
MIVTAVVSHEQLANFTLEEMDGMEVSDDV